MSEKPYTPTEHERESAEAREALWQALGKPDKLYEIASALTAAEECGRRRGVEERDELRALIRDVRPLVNETWLTAGPMTERGWESLLARIDAALAPRNSALAPVQSDYPGCGDPAHDCRDGTCGMGPAPRDSGKEG